MAAYTRTTVIDSAPAGDTVKEAVLDLDTDLTGIVAAYNAHDPATTAVHGVGAGTVCGTTLTQTLTNKTVSSPTLTGTVAASGATISNPTITAGTIQGASTLNALTFAAATTGWTGAGGTASKTLTLTADTSLDEAVAMSSKAPKANPTFTTALTTPSIKAAGAEQVKIWTYAHTITSDEITATLFTSPITTVTLTKVRGVIYAYLPSGGEVVWGYSTAYIAGVRVFPTEVYINLGASALANDVFSFTIVEAV